MIDDNEAAGRAAAWFASVRVPEGTRLVARPDLTRSQPLGWMFFADLVPAAGPPRSLPAHGNGPVVIDRRNGAITPLGTAGQPDALFAGYHQRYAQAPPPAQAPPAPATQPAAPLRQRPRGRPTRPIRPRGQVPPRPWPPPGARPGQPGQPGQQ